MTTDLLKYKETDLIFMDIETAREYKEISTDHPKFHTFRLKMRDRDTDELPSEEETKELYNKKAGLYPIYSRIVCITMGFISKDKIYLKTFSGEEKDILTDTVNTLKENAGKTLVWWNQAFDLPAIRQRFILNGLTGYLPDNIGNDSMKKPWTLKGTLDLMDVWKGIRYSSDSLGEVSVALGLSNPKEGDVEGSQVSEVYHEEGDAKIIKYCERDVSALINIYRKFTYKEIIEEIIIKTGKKQKQKHNIFQKLALDMIPTEKEQATLDARIESLEGEEKVIALELVAAAKHREKPMW